MKSSAIPKVLTAALFAAVLAGCGGGGGPTATAPTVPTDTGGGETPERCQTANPPDDCASIDPPPGSEAVQRAIDAAAASLIAAEAALAACAVAPAACDAADRAAQASVIAQDAADAAVAATTLAEVEQASNQAVAAAMTAEDAKLEAEAIRDKFLDDPTGCTGRECEQACPADVSPDDCPPPAARELIDRAIEAANEASRLADEAQRHCVTASAACDAAQAAREAADRAENARVAAETATSLAEVLRAVDDAEVAARAAAEAAEEAERLAASEPPDDGGQPPDDGVNWPDWPIDPVAARPLVGGLAIEDISSEAILAQLEAVAGLTTPYPHGDVYKRGNVDWWRAPNVEFSPVMRTAGNIPLFQARTSDQRFPNSREAPKAFIGYGGWMDYSYFIMGLSTSDSIRFFYNPDNPKPYDATASGYAYGVYDYSPPTGEKFYKVDMHWLGAVTGSDKTLAIPNFVQGTVHMTIRQDFRYDTRMEVDFNNLVNLTTGSLYHPMEWEAASVTGNFFDSLQGSPEGNRDYTIFGQFTGPNAEEAVGWFDRDSLTGVFGAKRHTCIPAPCRH